MHKALVAFAVALLTQAPVAAAQQQDVMAVVNKFITGFNTGDVAGALATCVPQAPVIDEFSPHEWHGAGACAKWAADFDADSKKNGITDPIVTMAAPKHVDISGDRAYVVAPVSYVFKQKGKPVSETGSLMTLALRKEAAGWRITGWAWTKN